MEVPPPMPSSHRDGGNRSLKILLVLLVFVGIPCIVGTFLIVSFVRTGLKAMKESLMPAVSCAINIEAGRDALLAYAKDHEGRLPKAERWQEEVQPYYVKASSEFGTKEVEVLGQKFSFKRFSESGPWGCDTGSATQTGIAFNIKLSGAKLADIESPANTVMIFEIEEARMNAAEEYVPKPKSKSKSPKVFGETRDWIKAFVEGKGPFSSGEYNPSNIPIKQN